jgi:hypothetical protein
MRQRFKLFMKSIATVLRLVFLATLAATQLQGADAPVTSGLEDTFRHPPHAARPSTWWHWMNGNITDDGIAKDLAAMKQIGLGGVYLFDAGYGYPEGPVRFMTEPWLRKMDQVFATSERLGLDFGVHNCDGFSQSGGPWITPETSMKVFTWSATDVDGGREFSDVLPVPAHKLDFYRDVAVVAFPLPPGGRFNGPGSGVKLAGAAPAAELDKLVDGDPATLAEVGPVTFSFAEPRTLRAVVFRGEFIGKDFNNTPVDRFFPVKVEASDDGQVFRPIGAGTLGWNARTVTIGTEAASARHFRVTTPARAGEIELTETPLVHFAESRAAQANRITHGVELAYHRLYPGPDPLRPLPAAQVLAPESVRNLSARMAADGRLTWTVPPGRWRVLRFGFTTTGAMVGPATREGSGLECDKLDPAVVRMHLDRYVGKLVARAGARAGKVFDVMETDSWECGVQNWTAGLEQRFTRATGHDLLAWLPALTEGRIIGDADRTERFLWDWRRFLADQFSESYFQVIHAWAHEHGLTYISEPTGNQQWLYDVANHRFNDRPMGEFWASLPGQGVRIDNKIAASMAHITGRAIVTAEAFTSQLDFSLHPAMLKRLGDEAFCTGVNHFTFHTYAHQPYETFGPGFTFGPWGLHFNRANTWWRTGGAWIDYIARSCALLQQGQPVADVLYYVGEDVPNRIGWRDELRPALPAGYDYDGADVTAVMEARVEDGRIVLPGGQRYRVLLLPSQPQMRPTVLEKIAALVRDGAVVVGSRPVRSPSLRDVGAGDARLVRLAAELWGSVATGVAVDRAVGRGRVFDGLSFEEIFYRLGVPTDFGYTNVPRNARLLYTHRRTADADIYFVSNQDESPVSVEASFRVGAKQPELWHPDNGQITCPAIAHMKGDRLTMPLRLEGAGSVFVVFRKTLPARHVVSVSGDTGQPSDNLPDFSVELDSSNSLVARVAKSGHYRATLADGRELTIPVTDHPAPLPLDGPWQVTFADVPASPGAITFQQLVSWSEHADERVRHFSGTAVYQKRFDIRPDRLGPDRELHLDLGEVRVHAEVEVNGRPVAILWKAPYRVRIDPFVKSGTNELVVRVANLWPNRMIGDARQSDDIARTPAGYPQALPDWLLAGKPRPGPRVSFSVIEKVNTLVVGKYLSDDPLLPSGLLGPVTLRTVVSKPLAAVTDRQ